MRFEFSVNTGPGRESAQPRFVSSTPIKALEQKGEHRSGMNAPENRT